MNSPHNGWKSDLDGAGRLKPTADWGKLDAGISCRTSVLVGAGTVSRYG